MNLGQEQLVTEREIWIPKENLKLDSWVTATLMILNQKRL